MQSLQSLFETSITASQSSQFIWQGVPDNQSSHCKGPTANNRLKILITGNFGDPVRNNPIIIEASNFQTTVDTKLIQDLLHQQCSASVTVQQMYQVNSISAKLIIKQSVNNRSATIKRTISCTFWLQFRDFFHVLNHWRLCSTEPFNFKLNHLSQVIETHTWLIYALLTDYNITTLFQWALKIWS